MDKHVLEVTVAIENMTAVMAFIEENTACLDNPKVAGQLIVVVEELALNVFDYAYDGNQGILILSISNDTEHRRIEMEFRDNGKAYNPLARQDPDIGVPISEREIGGLGILLSKQLTDEQHYIREDGQNILTVVKNY